MSRQLHIGFDLAEQDSVQRFVSDAPDALYRDDLVRLFVAAMHRQNVTGHFCCMVDQDDASIPLVGDMPDLMHSTYPRPVVTIDSETPEGVMLRFTLAPSMPPGRRLMAQLHLLVTVYAAHLLPLVEAEGSPYYGHPTYMEQQCFERTLAGSSNLDISEALGISPRAVQVHLRRLAAKLGMDISPS